MAATEEQIRQLVQEVVKQVLMRKKLIPEESPAPSQPAFIPPSLSQRGIFATMDEAIDAAEIAQRQLMSLTLETRKKIIDAIRQAGLKYAREIAQRKVEETKIGRVEDEMLKLKIVAEKTPGIEDLPTIAWSGDHGLTTVELAPYGIIGAVTPVTHPVPTIMNNAISIIAAGNSVVFNPHPASKNVSRFGIDIFNSAIIDAGGPPNLLTMVSEPTIETAQILFRHPKIDLLLITGGPGVVKAAMASSKKVIAAGPGNPPVVVDETADIPKAARDIVTGASFDNNSLCIGEKEIFVVEQVADQLKREMIKNGCYELSPYQLDQLAQKMFIYPKEGKGEVMLNRELVGRDAAVLAAAIGLDIDPQTRLLIAETHFDHPFVQEEQLCPVVPIVRCKDVDEAIELAVKAEHGYGHTAVIHSRNIANMHKMARAIKTTIFVKNGPSSAGLGVGGEGYTSFSIAGTTGEGITSARHFTRMRRCVLVDYFRIT